MSGSPTRIRWPFRMVLAVLVIFMGHAFWQETRYEEASHAYQIVPVVDGLEFPWGLAFMPNGDFLVTERPGRLRVVRAGQLDPTPVTGVPEVWYGGQGGMLDVALHPDFDTNRWVYLSYSRPGTGRLVTTAVSRGRLEGNALVDVEEVFVAEAWAQGPVHFGSRIVFDRQGYLYVSVGERGEMDQAQNPGNHKGTINRLHDDGTIPEDNPFVGQPGHQPSIYAWGNRSPQGLTIHPETGELWETEHGARGGDELNHIRAGRNYGWPIITHGVNYNGRAIGEGIREREGLEQPVHFWVPSIATSGLTFYSGDRFPQWQGDAFVGGLAGEVLARVIMDGDQAVGEEALMEGYERRIRAAVVGPDGFIYVLTDHLAGAVVRLEPLD